MAAVSLVWRSNHTAVTTPYASGAAVLRRDGPGAHQVVVEYRPFHRLAPADLPRRIVLARTLSTSPGADSASMEHLPAGVYEVAGSTIGPSRGHLQVKAGRLSAPLADWEAASLGSSWTRQVTIPVAVAELEIEADAAAGRTIRNVSVRALSVSEPQEGLNDGEARRGGRYGPAMLFLMGGDAWVEPGGTWIAGRSNAEFVIVPDPQSTARLFVRNGPVDNEVTLQSAAWRENLKLRPGEERLVSLPVERRRPATPLNVTAANGFRPADVDSRSDDQRFLGAWIETR